MLTRLQLENFKSWRSVELDLAPLTLLFGTNSSGKTAILQSLLLLKQTANNFDRKQHINFGGSERDYVDFGSWRDLVFGHDVGQNIGIGWHFTFGKSKVFAEMDYSTRWSYSQDVENVFIDRLKYDSLMSNGLHLFISASRKDRDQYEYFLSASESTVVSSTPPESCYALPIEIFRQSDETPRDVRIDAQYQPNYNSYFENIIGSVSYLGPLRQYPKRTYQWSGAAPTIIEPNGENTIAALIAAERRGEPLLSSVSRWLGNIGVAKEFQLEAVDPQYGIYRTQVTIGSTVTSLLDVGFGISQVLPVITMLFFAPEGSLILLEQPELHLHPNAQAHLADLLLRVAETRNLQLVVESHSEHLLRRLQRRIAEDEYPFATPENIKMYFCNIEDGESKAHPVEVDQYGQINNWPENFFGDITGDLEAMTRAALHKVMNGGERR